MTALEVTAKPSNKKKSASQPFQDATDLLNSRISRELVIAFCGPVGSESEKIVAEFHKQFTAAGYEVEPVKVSGIISSATDLLIKQQPTVERELFEGDKDKTLAESQYERIKYLQNAGNYLREKHDRSILAQFVAREIMLRRGKHAKPTYEELVRKEEIDQHEISLAQYSAERFVPNKTVYLVDQLKNPAEVDLLRSIYGELFYLAGVVRTKDSRIDFLKNEYGLTAAQAEDLNDRDRKQEKKHQQQLEKTLFRSDYFFSSQSGNAGSLTSQVKRFKKLIHRIGMSSPTLDEHSMYIAHSSALKSACLSRQVGAAIVDDNGNIIATGRNDVPRRKGGLYSVANNESDMRCYNHGKECFNDKYKKSQIRDKIDSIISNSLSPLEPQDIQKLAKAIDDDTINNSSELSGKLADTIYENTRISSLIEFSRAVHAEMDAITSVARSGSGSTQDTTIFSTTFPCHNCAGHIVSSGIKRVVYIEPYEKSEATRLYKTEISLDKVDESKVVFEHFQGVAPSRYQDFFQDVDGRKNKDGGFVDNCAYDLDKAIHPFLDSYRTLEVKIAQRVNESPLSESICDESE